MQIYGNGAVMSFIIYVIMSTVLKALVLTFHIYLVYRGYEKGHVILICFNTAMLIVQIINVFMISLTEHPINLKEIINE